MSTEGQLPHCVVLARATWKCFRPASLGPLLLLMTSPPPDPAGGLFTLTTFHVQGHPDNNVASVIYGGMSQIDNHNDTYPTPAGLQLVQFIDKASDTREALQPT